MPTNDHPTVTLTHSFMGTVQIDADMAPIIAATWAAGIDTVTCCQDEAGRATIGFLGLADMERFYELVAERGDDDALFYSRGWEWGLWADGGLEGVVHFPREDLPWVTRRLNEKVDA